MSDDDASFAAGIVIGVILSLIIGLIISGSKTQRWHKEAIERGYAEYNQTTGEWQWKEKR